MTRKQSTIYGSPGYLKVLCMDDSDFPQNGKTICFHMIGFQPMNIAKFINEVYNSDF